MGLLGKLFGKGDPRDAFAGQIIQKLRDGGFSDPLDYDSESFAIRFGDGRTSYLSNLYEEYHHADEDDRDAVVEAWIRVLFEPEVPTDPKELSEMLAVRVRDRAFVDYMELLARADGQETVSMTWRDLADELVLELVVDFPNSVRSICDSDLEAAGIEVDEAFRLGTENLASATEDNVVFMGMGEEDGPIHLYRSAWADTYDATRIVFPEMISNLETVGDPVVMIPNRDTLLVAGADDPTGMAMLADRGGEAYENEPRPLTGLAFRLEDRTWTPYLPAVDHPAHERFRELSVKTLGTAYADQKELLDKAHENEGKDVFVARFSGVEKDDKIYSYSVWSKDVDTLLPRSDLVAFYDPDKSEEDTRIVKWQEAYRVAGKLLSPMGMHPERYFTTGFPTDEQLALMGDG